MVPIIDPVGAVVLCADTSNVETVIIAGKVQKRDGKLVADWKSARNRVQESSDYLVNELEKTKHNESG